MKNTRKCWSEVTCYGPYVMYEISSRKWKKYEDIKSAACSHAKFKTINRARKAALSLYTKFKCKVVLLHWIVKNGSRLCKEYVIN